MKPEEMSGAVHEAYLRGGREAIYQIRRVVAQLDSAKLGGWNELLIRDTAASVLAQLRAYLETVDKS